MYSWGANFVVIPTTYAVTIDDGSLLRITNGYSSNSTTDYGRVFMMDDSLRYQGRQPNHGEQSALLRHEEQHADKFGISRTDFNYAHDTCPCFAHDDPAPSNAIVEMHIVDDKSIHDTYAYPHKMVRHTDDCSGSELRDSVVDTTRHHWFLTLTWFLISTRLLLNDIAAGTMTVDTEVGVTTFHVLKGIDYRYCNFTVQRCSESMDIDSSYGLNLMMDCINGSSGWKSRPHFMIKWMDPTQLNDDMKKRSLSWGAMSNDDESDAWIVDNYPICTCDDDGMVYDMDNGTMLYDTGVDLACLAADNSTGGRDVLGGTRCLHGTVLDTRFAADNGFVDTIRSECTGLLYNEALTLKVAPFDIGIYAARTTLEKTMIKPTSHCLELLFHGQSTSSGYDDPNTAENILPARRRLMFIVPIVNVKLHHDMFSIKSYVVNTHDCLHKCHHTLMHHCTNGTTDSGTGQHKLIAISVEFNHGDILIKNWTSH